MKGSRIIGAVVSGALLGVVPLAVAPPAHALALTSTATLAASPTFAEYGDSFSMSGTVTAVDPATGASYSVFAGTASLQIQTPKDTAWKTIQTDDTPSSFYFLVKAVSNANYQIVYSGGTYLADTYSPATSAPVGVKVVRKVKVRTEGLTIFARTTPDFKRKRVLIDRKAGGWKRFKVVRSDKSGRWSVTLPGRRGNGYTYRVTVPGNASYAPWRAKYVARIYGRPLLIVG